MIAKGIDPIEQKQEAKSLIQKEQHSIKSFEECALAYIETKQEEWKNIKHRNQWVNTLTSYAFPVIGQMNVAHIELPEILTILEPIWKEKTETASRLRGRIEAVLDWATVRGYRAGLNPARWKGHLDTVLQAPSKITKVVNHRAMPIEQISAFMKRLKTRQDTITAQALAFLILTAARSGEVRGAQWSEVDFKNAVWIIPAHRMKAGNEHRVPLCKQAFHLLQELPHFTGNDLIFPAPRGGMLSDMALTALMRRMQANAVPHGFRSTFRDWVAEKTNYPRDMAEFALAHTLDNKTEAAYLRTDMLEKRRGMMQDWADFMASNEVIRYSFDHGTPS